MCSTFKRAKMLCPFTIAAEKIIVHQEILVHRQRATFTMSHYLIIASPRPSRGLSSLRAQCPSSSAMKYTTYTHSADTTSTRQMLACKSGLHMSSQYARVYTHMIAAMLRISADRRLEAASIGVSLQAAAAKPDSADRHVVVGVDVSWRC